jgi:hypothetical protein
MHVCVYIYTYTHANIHTIVHTYIHTYTPAAAAAVRHTYIHTAAAAAVRMNYTLMSSRNVFFVLGGVGQAQVTDYDAEADEDDRSQCCSG